MIARTKGGESEKAIFLFAPAQFREMGNQWENDDDEVEEMGTTGKFQNAEVTHDFDLTWDQILTEKQVFP